MRQVQKGALAAALLVALATPAWATALPQPAALDTAVFAGGCFWGVEGVFEHVKGVVSATSGFAGGAGPALSYKEVSSGSTGHAESVEVVYDPAQVSYQQLLEIFFKVAHDPTQLNRQGPDIGPQYRSIVFYRDSAQRQAAKTYLTELRRSGAYNQPVVTELQPLRGFYAAEAYHQDYMDKHPKDRYIVVNDAPKVVELKKVFPALYREREKA